tara:strand:- start:922 stop:1101 length:180 start_codon:yes stop_codon:yes gene_type:complete
MPRYEVTLTIDFVGEIEAESREEAERLAIYDETCLYFGVNDIEIAELEEEEEEDEEGEE